MNVHRRIFHNSQKWKQQKYYSTGKQINGNLFQYSCLGNFRNRRAWWAMVHGVAKELDMAYRLNNKVDRHRGILFSHRKE